MCERNFELVRVGDNEEVFPVEQGLTKEAALNRVQSEMKGRGPKDDVFVARRKDGSIISP